MTYHVKVLSPANIVEVEEDVNEEDLQDVIQCHKEDYLDVHPGYTLEITANL